jgi:hypothetical protein
LISCLCLGVKSRTLVLNAITENLDALNGGGWGVFIAPPTKMSLGRLSVDGRTRQSGAPPDTVWCASHVTQPLGFDRWSSDNLGHQTVTVHCPVRLLAPALTLRAQSAHFSRTVHLLQTTVGAVAVTPHGTPDSPVPHRTVR